VEGQHDRTGFDRIGFDLEPRFDLGEAMLEIALVITSITLLTRKQAFMHMGWVFGGIGLICIASVALVH